MKRKLRCKNVECESDPVYVQGSTIPMMLISAWMECLECGDKRREHERKRKQRSQKKLLARFSAESERL